MPNRDPRDASVYVYGTGWGSKVTDLLVEQGYKVIGMWSIDEVELLKIKEKHQISFTTTDKDELLAFQEKNKKSGQANTLVWIATPPFLLSHVTKEILTLGYHVVVEAPGASSVEEAEELYKGATQFATWLCRCTYQLRYLPSVQRLKSLLDNHEFGIVRNIEVRIHCNQMSMCGAKYNWKHDRDRCGGALNMFGAHIIDLLLYLLNETKVDSAQGVLHTFIPKNEHINGFREITSDDVCNFQLRFKPHHATNVRLKKEEDLPTHLIAWVHISMLHPDTVFKQEVTMVTDRATLLLDNCDLRITPHQKNENLLDSVQDSENGGGESEELFSISDLAAGSPAPYILGMKYFIKNLIVERHSLFNDKAKNLEELQHLMKVLQMIRDSSVRKELNWLSIEPKTRVPGGGSGQHSSSRSSSQGRKSALTR